MSTMDEILHIRLRLLSKELSYEEAKELAMPIIEEMNKKSAEIAKKYNVRAKKFNFSSLMR